eukprot:9780126-Alexandrium_andersonii.AAC.1
MQIRAPRSAAPLAPASGERGSAFQQIPSHGEGCLALRASWDGELPGWILRPRPIFDRRAKRRNRSGSP